MSNISARSCSGLQQPPATLQALRRVAGKFPGGKGPGGAG